MIRMNSEFQQLEEPLYTTQFNVSTFPDGFRNEP